MHGQQNIKTILQSLDNYFYWLGIYQHESVNSSYYFMSKLGEEQNNMNFNNFVKLTSQFCT